MTVHCTNCMTRQRNDIMVHIYSDAIQIKNFIMSTNLPTIILYPFLYYLLSRNKKYILVLNNKQYFIIKIIKLHKYDIWYFSYCTTNVKALPLLACYEHKQDWYKIIRSMIIKIIDIHSLCNLLMSCNLPLSCTMHDFTLIEISKYLFVKYKA